MTISLNRSTLANFWHGLRSHQVYRLDAPSWVRASRLFAGWTLARQIKRHRALLDTLPLVDTLHRALDLQKLEVALELGALEVLGVTASSYSTGEHWIFCQTRPDCAVQPWHRPGRRADFQPITIEHATPDVLIDTNVEVFEETLSKLLINAWESYHDEPDDKRPINIRTEVVERPEEGRFALVHIEDRGRGIDPEIKDHAFEPFTSTKHTVGVGMGLTVARHSMRNLGGEVTLTDRPGGGAICTIRHPLERKNKDKA